MSRFCVRSALRHSPLLKPSKGSIPSLTAVSRSISTVTTREFGVSARRHRRSEVVKFQISPTGYSFLRRDFSGVVPTRIASPTSASTASSSLSSSTSSEEPVIEPRLSLTFTCTAPIATTSAPSSSSGAGAMPESPPVHKCGHRSSHTFTKRAYEKGIVIISCPSCKNRHLIADNLGWFKNQDGSEGGKTVEDFVKAKGETVKRGTLLQTAEGDIEFVP